MGTELAVSRVPALRDVITFAQSPGDDIRTRDLKAMSTVTLLVIMGLSLSYWLLPGRSAFSQTFDAIILLVEITGLIVLYRTRSTTALFYAFVPPYLALMAFFVTFNGSTEGDFMSFMATPCAAVIVLGPRRSVPWFLLCLVTMIVLPLIDPVLPRISLPSAVSPLNPEGLLFHSPWKKPIGPVEGIAFATVVFVIYFLFRSVYMQLDRAKAAVEVEKAKVDRLMHAVFPATISARLQESTGEIIAQTHRDATVLFADIVDFTPLASSLPAAGVVQHLDRIFTLIDTLSAKHGVEKIKTIGDAYMAVSGLPDPATDHAARMAAFALDLRDEVHAFQREAGNHFVMRIGLTSGPVIAGIIGQSKPSYDVWGNTVNMAGRLESHGQPDQIQVTTEFAAQLADRFTFSPPHQIALKGIGTVEACFLTGMRAVPDGASATGGA
ncbi:adenylate/guanylate cyclase domain-containing protein [Aliishimia ponticola]|nr:adenylate/guanylate cyclase domain-containing protein [Aliishimia ponticola]